MPQANPFEQLFKNNFSKSFAPMSSLKPFPFDMKTWMETQRKNMKALTEAQQLAIESLQAIAQRNSEILSQIVEDNSAIAKEVMGEGTPEEKIVKQTDIVKKSYEKSIMNARELADMISKSNQEASDIINKRISASLGEIKAAIEKGGQQKSK